MPWTLKSELGQSGGSILMGLKARRFWALASCTADLRGGILVLLGWWGC